MADPNDDPRNRAPDQDVPPVIIACAGVESATAEQAAVALRARGHVVEVVSGVEHDEALLADAIVRHLQQGLYVLCRSPSLPRQRIDRLRAVLRNNEVPFGRTLTLAIEVGQARGLEERIVSVARRMITGKVESVRPPVRPLPRSMAVAVASGFGEDVVTRVEGDKAASRSPVTDAQVEAWADSFADALPGAPDEVDSGDSMEITQRNPPSPDESGGIDYAVHPPSYSGVDITQVAPGPRRPVATVRAPAIPVEPGSAPGISELVDQADDAGLGSAELSLAGGLGARKRTRIVGLSLGGIALLIIAVVGVTKLSATPPASGDARAEEKLARADGDAASSAESEPADAGGVADPDRVEVEPHEAPEAAAAAAGESAGEADEDAVEADASDASVEEVEAEHVPAAVDHPEEPARNDAVSERERPTPVLEDSPRVLAALRSRDVRAIDTLLVASKTSQDLAFSEAQAFCAELKVAELEGWRLPAIGELWTLGDAKMMKPGVYWSDTVGDAHGEKRMVLNSKRSRIVPVDASWNGARAVCIRERS